MQCSKLPRHRLKVYRFSDKLITPKGCYVRTSVSKNGIEFFRKVPVDRNDKKIIDAVKKLRPTALFVLAYGGNGETIIVAESYAAANVHHQLQK